MIKYLFKFVSERAHADFLLDGNLFMRPACYYHKIEAGQGDLGEAAISHDICVYKHSHVPIYCAYAVDELDIIGGTVAVSERCVKDFNCENGYVVIIDFQKFDQALTTLLSHGYEVDVGLVNYHKLTFEDTGELLCDNTPKNLFVKRPSFSYQKEFRIVVCREVYKVGEPPIDHITYCFPHNLRDMAVCKEVAQFERKGDYFLLSTANIFDEEF